MATKILIKRGTEAARSASIPDTGELILTTDTNKLFLGNSATTGGLHLTASIAQTASYILFGNVDGKPSLISSSAQVVNSLPIGTVSSSAQTVSNLVGATIAPAIISASFITASNLLVDTLTANVTTMSVDLLIVTTLLRGTASYALEALTASFAQNFNPSATASYAINAATASYISGIDAGTASYALESITASYALRVDGGFF